MFQKGDFVTYGCKGVCEVKDVTTLKMDGIPKDKLYYELQPVSDAQARIFTPASLQESKNVMRPILSKQEAESILDEVRLTQEEWISEDRERESKYREAVNHCDAAGELLIIKSLCQRKRYRALQGRKLSVLDSKYLKLAQDNIFRELALSLELDMEETEAYVLERIRAAGAAVKSAL